MMSNNTPETKTNQQRKIKDISQKYHEEKNERP